MKKISLILLVLLCFTFTSKADNGSDVITETILSKDWQLDSNETRVYYFSVPALYSDTLSFIIELLQADSLRTANLNTGDSLKIEVKMLPKSPGGYTAYKDTSNWSLVAIKQATDGRVGFGTNIGLLPSQQYGGAAFVRVKQLWATKQKFRFRIYSIRKFNK